MNELLRWILANGPSAALLVAAFTMFLTYLLAYFQGRAVSFWPPRIEGRPLRHCALVDRWPKVARSLGLRLERVVFQIESMRARPMAAAERPHSHDRVHRLVNGR